MSEQPSKHVKAAPDRPPAPADAPEVLPSSPRSLAAPPGPYPALLLILGAFLFLGLFAVADLVLALFR